MFKIIDQKITRLKSRRFLVDVLSRSTICKVDNCLVQINELQLFTLKMCWLKPVCEGNSRKIRGLTHHKVFILWIDLLCSKLSRNVKLHLFVATRKKKCENRITTKFILGNLFHIWSASLLDTSKNCPGMDSSSPCKSFTTAWQANNLF